MATVAPAGPDSLEITQREPLPASPSSRPKGATDTLASHILLYSFAAAVLLAISAFAVVAVYLFLYLHHAFEAFNTNSMAQLSGMDLTKLQPVLLARAGLWKFILQSCGIISGVAFGFLGFGLFLLGVKGDMDAAFADSQHKVQLSRMAPGSFVILIAAALIGICSIHKVDLSLDPITTTTETKIGQTAAGSDKTSAQSASASDPAINPNASPFDSSAPAGPAADKSGRHEK